MVVKEKTMKKFLTKIIPLSLGIISTILSYFWHINLGDFSFRGLPIPYQTGVWGMGMEYSFHPILFIIDILIWSIIWLLIVKMFFWLRKKYIAQHGISGYGFLQKPPLIFASAIATQKLRIMRKR